jgi:hypothetical protein
MLETGLGAGALSVAGEFIQVGEGEVSLHAMRGG